MTRRPRRTVRRLWWEVRANYADCNDWLASWCVPWRWVVDFYRATVDLRRTA